MIDRYKTRLEESGVSPVIGVILLVAVTVALVALATVIVFDLGDDVSNTADITLDVSEQNDGVDVTVVRNENVEELRVIDPDGEDESFSADVGSNALVQGEAGSYNVVAVLADGSEESVRTVTISEDSATESESVTGTVNVNPAIEGATVEAYENGELVDSDVTNADGEYTLTVSDREQAEIMVNVERFEFTDENNNEVTLSASDRSEASENVNFDFDVSGNGQEVDIGGETITIVNQVENDVTKIGNVDQLQAMNENLAGDYKLISDIDASETESWNDEKGFNPVGDFSNEFEGSFDGQGYEVDKLTIDRPTELDIGLIGSNNGGIIKNIGLVDNNINGEEYVGGLVGYNSAGEVINSYANGDVTGDSNVGGLVGYIHNAGEVSKSYSEGSVNSNDDVGGLVGMNYDGKVTNSYANGDVTGEGDRVGGLVGVNYDTVSESYATGSVTGDSNVGGLVGSNRDGSEVSESYATGSVTGDSNVGGLVGGNSDTVSESYWDTETSGKDVSDGGTGLTTSEMQGDSAEDNMEGFDFVDMWSNSDEYPILEWQE